MRFQADILAHNEEGILERILRVCRSRGYVSQSLRADYHQNERLLSISIEGQSERPLAQLSLQVKKLFDVIDVTVKSLPSEVQHHASEASPMHLNALIRRTAYVSSSRG